MIEFRTESPDFNAMLDSIEGVRGDDLQLPTPEYADFPGEEFARRYSRLRVLMEREGIELAILTQEENVRYFTGYLTVLWASKFRPCVGLLALDPSLGAGVVLPHQEMGNAHATSWVPKPIVFPAQEPPIGFLAREIRERGLDRSRIGIELGFGQRLGLSQQQWNELVRALPEAEFVDMTPLAQTVRMLKSELEIERIARACSISEVWSEERLGEAAGGTVRAGDPSSYRRPHAGGGSRTGQQAVLLRDPGR